MPFVILQAKRVPTTRANSRPALGDIRNQNVGIINQKSAVSLRVVNKVTSVTEEVKEQTPKLEIEVNDEYEEAEVDVVKIPLDVTDIDAQPIDNQNPQVCHMRLLILS